MIGGNGALRRRNDVERMRKLQLEEDAIDKQLAEIRRQREERERELEKYKGLTPTEKRLYMKAERKRKAFIDYQNANADANAYKRIKR